MDLDHEEIERFRQAWKNDFREDIGHEGARSELERLLAFFQLLYDAFYGEDRPDDQDDMLTPPAMSL